MIIKRRKNSRQRGSHTHGWGSKKKHRGKGHKGGAGRAGSGKRADSKKPSYWKEKKEKGFVKKNRKEIKTINIAHLEASFERLIKNNKIKKEKDVFIINLKDLGYDKILSKGEITKKMVITVKSASKKIIEKLKKNGGEIIVS